VFGLTSSEIAQSTLVAMRLAEASKSQVEARTKAQFALPA
jgi:hypothetical protein